MSEKRDLAPLPARFSAWFQSRGWAAHDHQLSVLAAVQAGRSALLIAPTGGGKTLAGFLPSLVELVGADPKEKRTGIHTLYISPLKALTCTGAPTAGFRKSWVCPFASVRNQMEPSGPNIASCPFSAPLIGCGVAPARVRSSR